MCDGGWQVAALAQERAALEILVVGSGSIGARAASRRGNAERELERVADMLRDLVLESENALQLAIVGLRPNVKAIRDADQLRGDPHLRAIAAHAALDDIRDSELAPDLADIAALALELKDRGARHDLELRHLGEHVQ